MASPTNDDTPSLSRLATIIVTIAVALVFLASGGLAYWLIISLQHLPLRELCHWPLPKTGRLPRQRLRPLCLLLRDQPFLLPQLLLPPLRLLLCLHSHGESLAI
jgi:hypothetical protein